MKNLLYSGDPAPWNALTLAEKVEAVRKHLCTGPCGASMAVAVQRDRINTTLQAVLASLSGVPDRRPELHQWRCPCCARSDCDGYCSVDRFDGSGGFDR